MAMSGVAAIGNNIHNKGSQPIKEEIMCYFINGLLNILHHHRHKSSLLQSIAAPSNLKTKTHLLKLWWDFNNVYLDKENN